MKHRRLLGAVALGVSTSTLGAVGLSGVAAAQSPADDIPVIIDNIPDAVQALVDGVQVAIDAATATTPPSAVALSEGIGQALVAAGGALVADTVQFGALALGLGLMDLVVQQNLAPYLGAIDDPSTIGSLVNPDDLTTILSRLPAAVDGLLHGNSGDNGALAALAELLRGNLIAGPGFAALGPGVVGNLIAAIEAATVPTTEGTNYASVPALVGVPLIIGAIAGADYVQQVEDVVGPALAGLGAVLNPVAEILEAI